MFVSSRRRAHRRNQAGEGGKEAIRVEKAGVAQERERFVGPEQTPQEPRWWTF